MAETYDVGDVVRVSSVFTQNDVPLDPTTISLSMKLPDGTISTYTYGAAQITKDSTGSYHRDFQITVRGVYRYRWFSTGLGEAAEENWFQVRTQRVA